MVAQHLERLADTRSAGLIKANAKHFGTEIRPTESDDLYFSQLNAPCA